MEQREMHESKLFSLDSMSLRKFIFIDTHDNYWIIIRTTIKRYTCRLLGLTNELYKNKEGSIVARNVSSIPPDIYVGGERLVHCVQKFPQLFDVSRYRKDGRLLVVKEAHSPKLLRDSDSLNRKIPRLSSWSTFIKKQYRHKFLPKKFRTMRHDRQNRSSYVLDRDATSSTNNRPAARPAFRRK